MRRLAHAVPVERRHEIDRERWFGAVSGALRGGADPSLCKERSEGYGREDKAGNFQRQMALEVVSGLCLLLSFFFFRRLSLSVRGWWWWWRDFAYPAQEAYERAYQTQEDAPGDDGERGPDPACARDPDRGVFAACMGF